MQSLKNLTWTVSVKKPIIKFLSNQETRLLPPLNMCESKKKNSGLFKTCLMYLTILESFNLIG